MFPVPILDNYVSPQRLSLTCSRSSQLRTQPRTLTLDRYVDVGGVFMTLGVMSVLLETSLGDIVLDLLVDEAPKACEK